MRHFKQSFIALSLLSVSSFSQAGLLTIDIDNTGGLSESQFTVFDQAKDIWGSLLTGIQSSFDLTISISASASDIDGNGGVLGRAGPTQARVDNELGFAYASVGNMEFDRADLDDLESKGTLFDVIFHEISHVLGYGTLWNTDSFGGVFSGTQSVYEDGSGQYTGAYALEAYRNEFDADALFIPVELDGGEGTADSHWDEAWEGGSQEVLTGYLGQSSFLSDTSIASFADIGYTTVVTHSVDSESVEVSAPTTLALFSLGLIFAFKGRRKNLNRLA